MTAKTIWSIMSPRLVHFTKMLFGNCRNTPNPTLFPASSNVIRLWDGGTRMALMNPASGVYDFSKLDTYLAQSEAAGMDSIYTFGSTPAWAAIPTSGVPGIIDPTSNRPMDLTALSEFVAALMAHTGNRIRYFETWNEWNADVFWVGTMEQLIAQQAVIYYGVKKDFPSAMISTPSPCWNPSNAYPTVDTATDAFLNIGAPFDMVTFHGYLPNGVTATAIKPTLQALKAVLAKHNVTAPMWDTEFGPNSPSNVAADQQRCWLFDSLIARAQEGVSLACWYQWDNQKNGTCVDLSGNLTTFGQAWVDFYEAYVGK